jgi:serine/threonine protein kinase
VATTAIMSTSTFLKIIRDNALVEEEKLQGCLRTLTPAVLTGADALPIADALVEAGLLTRFQANLLLQGKSKSLRITSKYRLLDRLGAGGMGLVYLCEHIKMKRLVALKVLPNSQAKEAGNLERFHREAQAVAALKHQNIVQAYDVDTDNGIHYLVMEYIDGLNLEKLVSKHGPLDPIRAAHYIAQSAEGLQHAAERGLVHRDIKPSNLLIDREGYIKVLDMGLARFFDTRTDNLTERFDSHAVIGTADFISPEQALNSHEVDSRADIYSLGCTFYYLLSGRAPFHDANITQKLLMHQVREPVPIEETVPGIDPDLADVVRKMMAKRPEDRYQTPGDVVAALVPWTEEPITPPSELPENPHTAVVDRNGTVSNISNQQTSGSAHSTPRQAPRPGRGMVTERITESAIRRMDSLPKKSREEAAENRNRWIIGGVLLLVAIGGLVLVVSRWGSAGNTKRGPTDEEIAAEKAALARTSQKQTGKKGNSSKAQPLGSGFVAVRMDVPTSRPAVQNGGIRLQATDVLSFSGDYFASTDDDYFAAIKILRAQMSDGAGDRGAANDPIIPFAVAASEGEKTPNTLVTIDGQNLRPLAPASADFHVTKDFAAVKPDWNVLVRENATLPPGVTTINSLVTNAVNVSAAPGGSTLRIKSGALLITSKTIPNLTAFGAGKNPLSLDFNGRTGYVTLCSDQDFTRLKGGGAYVLRAQVVNLGAEPLVLSGTKSAVLHLENPKNANAKLVIQGGELKNEEPFRVICIEDGNLGAPKAPVSLIDAALYFNNPSIVEVDRPLNISRISHLGEHDPTSALHWLGKISGGKLITHGPGKVVLSRSDNDYSGGTSVDGKTLVLAGEDGSTPAGLGSVTVTANGALHAASGTIKKDLIVKGGILTLGSDKGKSFICDGKFSVESSSNKVPLVQFQLSGKARPLICYGPIELTKAKLEFSFVNGFAPEKGAKYFLIENRTKNRALGKFDNASHQDSATKIKSKDGKWSARVSYTGNADHNSENGGNDVVLYDITPTAP